MKMRIAIILLLAQAIPAAAVTIATVPVGDVGNPNDPLTGNLYGGVNYAYNIGKYEITIGQYVEFLNAVAATDPKNLWTVGLSVGQPSEIRPLQQFRAL